MNLEHVATFQVSLWERLVLDWIDWMRHQAPDIAVRVETDYSSSQMRQLSEGWLDIGVMYQPSYTSGLSVENLFDESLILVSTKKRSMQDGWVEDYVYIDWGDVFRTAHAEAFPQMETAAVTMGLGPLGLQYILKFVGSGYFPLRVVGSHLERGELFYVEAAPEMRRPVYMVYREEPVDPDLQALALDGLRRLVEAENKPVE